MSRAQDSMDVDPQNVINQPGTSAQGAFGKRSLEPEGPAAKMVKVDFEGKPVGGSGRRQGFSTSAADKAKCNQAVAAIYMSVKRTFKFASSIECQIACLRQMNSAYNALRQSWNGSNAVYNKWADGVINISIHGDNFSAAPTDLKKAITAALHKSGCTPETRSIWGGSVSQVMAIWCEFAARFEDVRYTPSGLIISKNKSKNETYTRSFDMYGIPSSYRSHCVGAGWPVPVKSALAQSLGVGCQLCMLSSGANNDYNIKWENAVYNSFYYIPNMRLIAHFLKASPASENRMILQQLIHIASLVGARNNHRIVLPPEMYCEYFANDAHSYEDVDYSGRGAYKILYTQRASSYQINMTNAAVAQQLLTHMIFGSYTADLGVLSFMFEKPESFWETRKTVEPCLKSLKFKEPKVTNAVNVSPLIPAKVSKMSSALPANLVPNEMTNRPKEIIFSGKTTRKLTSDQLNTTGSGGGLAADPKAGDISRYLQEYTDKLVRKIEDSRMTYEVGTTEWMSIGDYIDKVENPVSRGTATETMRSYWDD